MLLFSFSLLLLFMLYPLFSGTFTLQEVCNYLSTKVLVLRLKDNQTTKICIQRI